MTTVNNEFVGNDNGYVGENLNVYSCEKCDYITHKKYNLKKHYQTQKHTKTTDDNGNVGESSKNIYVCEKCENIYNDRAGLWRHKKKCGKCKITDNIELIYNEVDESLDKDNLIMMLIKQNSELIKETSNCKNMMVEQSNKMMEQSNMMMEVIKNGTNNNNNNTTNSHNKAFNLQFFLNETCKDAMNITDFVESIKLQLSDTENVGKVGYVEGISSIIVRSLKELDVSQRPVHCTDQKRETMYIKDEDKWERDDDQKKMHKIVRKVTDKNARMVMQFKEVHPDCMTSSSRYSDQYRKIIMEAMCGRGDNTFEKEEKIIKKISKAVLVNKDNT